MLGDEACKLKCKRLLIINNCLYLSLFEKRQNHFDYGVSYFSFYTAFRGRYSCCSGNTVFCLSNAQSSSPRKRESRYSGIRFPCHSISKYLFFSYFGCNGLFFNIFWRRTIGVGAGFAIHAVEY